MPAPLKFHEGKWIPPSRGVRPVDTHRRRAWELASVVAVVAWTVGFVVAALIWGPA